MSNTTVSVPVAARSLGREGLPDTRVGSSGCLLANDHDRRDPRPGRLEVGRHIVVVDVLQRRQGAVPDEEEDLRSWISPALLRARRHR